MFFLIFSILELGSGNGFIGIVLALLGAKVILTDLKNLLPLIEENVKLNCKDLLDQKIFIKELEWGKTKIDDKYDMIVASDCIYDNENMWKDFSIAIDQLSSEKIPIIISYELRSQVDAKFFQHIKDKFDIQKIPNEMLDSFWVIILY